MGSLYPERKTGMKQEVLQLNKKKHESMWVDTTTVTRGMPAQRIN